MSTQQSDIIYPKLIGGIYDGKPAPPESHGLKPYHLASNYGPTIEYQPTRYISFAKTGRRITIVWFEKGMEGGSPNMCPMEAILYSLEVMEREAKAKESNQQSPTQSEIDSACLSYRHDYGLMAEADKQLLRCEAMDWLEAWKKAGVAKLERDEVDTSR